MIITRPRPYQKVLDPRSLNLPEPPDYACYRLGEPLTLDGRLEEPAWKKAPWMGPFVDMEKGTAVQYDTRVAFLWDEEAFYAGFWCEEPDVFGSETRRDGAVGNDQDFEIFILGEENYYELQINPLNTVYEVFWTLVEPLIARKDVEAIDRLLRTVRGRYGGIGGDYSGRHGSYDWDFPGLQNAVYVDGSLNWHRDRDRGWSGEIAFPWRGWTDLAHGKRNLPPKEGDAWRIGCSRVERGRDAEGNRAWQRDWSIVPHGKIHMHEPHRWPYVVFSTQTVDEAARK